MNHLLHQITWDQYLTVALVAAIIYYLLIILRNYRPELQSLQRRLTGDRQADHLQALQYQPEESGEEVKEDAGPLPDPVIQQKNDEAITEVDVLAGKLKVSITRAADKPFAPAVLIPQLKTILKDHLHIAASDRAAINSLIVTECEKTGTALLTEDEVDQWWES
jgi:hypothetical protein